MINGDRNMLPNKQTIKNVDAVKSGYQQSLLLYLFFCCNCNKAGWTVQSLKLIFK